MVRVEIEVISGPVRFNVVARAGSIRRALGMVEARFSCDEARLVHPIDPETFFDKEPVATEALTYREIPERVGDALKAAG